MPKRRILADLLKTEDVSNAIGRVAGKVRELRQPERDSTRKKPKDRPFDAIRSAADPRRLALIAGAAKDAGAALERIRRARGKLPGKPGVSPLRSRKDNPKPMHKR